MTSRPLLSVLSGSRTLSSLSVKSHGRVVNWPLFACEGDGHISRVWLISPRGQKEPRGNRLKKGGQEAEMGHHPTCHPSSCLVPFASGAPPSLVDNATQRYRAMRRGCRGLAAAEPIENERERFSADRVRYLGRLGEGGERVVCWQSMWMDCFVRFGNEVQRGHARPLVFVDV